MSERTFGDRVADITQAFKLDYEKTEEMGRPTVHLDRDLLMSFLEYVTAAYADKMDLKEWQRSVNIPVFVDNWKSGVLDLVLDMYSVMYYISKDVSEARGPNSAIGENFADLFHKLLLLAAVMGVDLESAVTAKLGV